MSEEREVEHGLVMPFVTVVSKDGPRPTQDAVMAEIITSVNAAAQPLMTTLADSIGHITRTLDAAWKSVLQEHRRR